MKPSFLIVINCKLEASRYYQSGLTIMCSHSLLNLNVIVSGLINSVGEVRADFSTLTLLSINGESHQKFIHISIAKNPGAYFAYCRPATYEMYV